MEELEQGHLNRVQEAAREAERVQDWTLAREIWSPDPGASAAPRYGPYAPGGLPSRDVTSGADGH
eukprot:5829768-Alexandrium_andersonii.AAC.1